MKGEIIIEEGLKSGNILVKNGEERGGEVEEVKGEVVIMRDGKGKRLKGF